MLEWFNNLDSAVQAAIITAVGGVLCAIIGLISSKKKKDKVESKKFDFKQNNSGGNNVQIGEHKQDGNGNTQYNYYNCNVQNDASDDKKVCSDESFIKEQIDKYMDEHTLSNEEIDKIIEDAETSFNETTDDSIVTPLPNAVMIRMKNLAGGNTVIIGEEKSITEQIIKEHNKDIEKH